VQICTFSIHLWPWWPKAVFGGVDWASGRPLWSFVASIWVHFGAPNATTGPGLACRNYFGISCAPQGSTLPLFEYFSVPEERMPESFHNLKWARGILIVFVLVFFGHMFLIHSNPIHSNVFRSLPVPQNASSLYVPALRAIQDRVAVAEHIETLGDDERPEPPGFAPPPSAPDMPAPEDL